MTEISPQTKDLQTPVLSELIKLKNMTKQTFYFAAIIIISLLFSCSSDDNNAVTNGTLSFNFTQNWDGESLNATDFNQIKYTNAHGEQLSISRLRYLISKIELTHSNGEVIVIDGYNLVDVTEGANLNFSSPQEIPLGEYTKLSFVFGFNEADNIPNNYVDLNSASWNWPEMLGDGYHFMQFEGKFIDGTEEVGYAYHMGTARREMNVFEANHFTVELGAFTAQNNTTVEIAMNVAEWFKNPNEWNLIELHAPLMPNYDAQIMMHENAASVFSLGVVSQ